MRLREQGVVTIEPDDAVGALLDRGECVVAVRRSVCLERRAGSVGPAAGISGDLYVTSRRLLHLGRTTVEYQLGEIREVVVANGALMLLVGADRGLMIRVPDPRLLRVQIAAAREALRCADLGPGADQAGLGPVSLDGQRPSR
jgi:hypothetical protein